jgi:hypothetical protein
MRTYLCASPKPKLLDCQYLDVVFIGEQENAAIAYQNQRVIHRILFQTTAETLRALASDNHHLGAEIGFFAVLHTWGSNLAQNPH